MVDSVTAGGAMMMTGMVIACALGLVVVLLVGAAAVKYLFFARSGRNRNSSR